MGWSERGLQVSWDVTFESKGEEGGSIGYKTRRSGVGVYLRDKDGSYLLTGM